MNTNSNSYPNSNINKDIIKISNNSSITLFNYIIQNENNYITILEFNNNDLNYDTKPNIFYENFLTKYFYYSFLHLIFFIFNDT